MKESPFLTHKEILLQGYSTARWLRGVTLALWNGDAWPVGLSRISNTDNQHFAIAMELLTWYRQHGENDPDFMATAQLCETIALEEKRRAEQQAAFNDWERGLCWEMRRNGFPDYMRGDYYDWFFERFEEGLTQAQAAERAAAEGLGKDDYSEERIV
jgi:hypothetical protein